MQPRTKLQKQVFEATKSLPEITPAQKKWGFENCFDHKGYRTKANGIYCLDCGHRFNEEQPHLLTSISGCNCPNCGVKLKITDTRKRKDKQTASYSIITTHKGFQVCRYFKLTGLFKAGKTSQLSCWELVQHWILPNGKYEIFARTHNGWNGDMAIRGKSPIYNLNPYKIYPKKQIIPDIKRNGFKQGFYNIAPITLFREILTNSHAETLIKSKQIQMLQKCVSEYNKFQIANLWSSIKICIRNNYIIADADNWIDYIDTLQFFNKDIHNAKYVCPDDLMKEHDRWMRKKRIRLDFERIEELKNEALNDEEDYRELRNSFFGLMFRDELISIKVIDSVQEVMLEGDALHHCVFTNDYHKRKDSLLLSAQINGERIATVEFSLKTFDVVQCRGLRNTKSEYHNRIIELVKSNKPQIKKRLDPAKSKSINANKVMA